mmetsp:Transcript_47669/g.136593  ORF Transcript_47669/g.136593 Transcript_47669/m.136593 type:complete len:314 (+) Transcript_47669:155-1096(+)
MSSAELSRDLIALARQGGATLSELRDQRLARAAAAAEAKEKAEQQAAARSGSSSGSRPKMSKMQRSSSTPGVAAIVRPASRAESSNERRGGGWDHSKGGDPLAKFKDKLEIATGRALDMDYSEKPLFRTALWEATWKNHEGIVRLLAAKGANVAAKDHQGRTPLHEAAYYGHASLLEFLLDKGHPVDPVDEFGQTPLFRAVEAGRHDVIKILVERGAETNRVDKDCVTVQHVAAFNGMEAMATYLYSKGAVRNRFCFDDPLRSRSLVALPATGLTPSGKAGLRKPPNAGASLMMLGDSGLSRRSRSSAALPRL